MRDSSKPPGGLPGRSHDPGPLRGEGSPRRLGPNSLAKWILQARGWNNTGPIGMARREGSLNGTPIPENVRLSPLLESRPAEFTNPMRRLKPLWEGGATWEPPGYHT